jgi:predicted amidohydrolase
MAQDEQDTPGDVAIKGSRLARIGKLANATATRTIDATGMVVASKIEDC